MSKLAQSDNLLTIPRLINICCFNTVQLFSVAPMFCRSTDYKALSVMEFFNDVGSDPYRPSLFELIAQEQLRDLLQPALKYVLAVHSVSITK